jgi:hypothetical protein
MLTLLLLLLKLRKSTLLAETSLGLTIADLPEKFPSDN